MARSFAAVAAGALALATAAFLIPVYAHEGHNKSAGASFDPNAPKKVSQATAMAVGLKTAEVDFGQVEDVVRLTGIVRARPDSLFAVAPAYAGVVRSIAVQPGDRVTKGSIVAEIDSPEIARLELDLKRAKSQVASLQIEVPALSKNAELSEAEVQRLVSAGESVSANLLAQRKAEAFKMRADAELRAVALVQAQADVESLEQQLGTKNALGDPTRPGLVRFAAPIDGVVITRSALSGEGVSAGTSILTIGDFSAIQIEGELPEGLLDRVSSAQNAKVRVRRGVGNSTEVIAEGMVRFISPVIDATKRTAHLIVDVDNAPGLLRQGQFVDLAVVLRSNDSAVVIPASAIVKEGPLQYVFIKDGKGENEFYQKRDIATGVRDDRVVEITSGLVPGDVIAVNGAFSISQLRGFVPGAPEPAPTTPAAGTSGDGHGHTH